jgi:hypothetical protein
MSQALLFGSAARHSEGSDPRRGIGCVFLVIDADVPKRAIIAGIHRRSCKIHPPGCVGLGCLALHQYGFVEGEFALWVTGLASGEPVARKIS